MAGRRRLPSPRQINMQAKGTNRIGPNQEGGSTILAYAFAALAGSPRSRSLHSGSRSRTRGAKTSYISFSRVHMKTTGIIAVAVLLVGSALALHMAQAQQLGDVKRTDLQRHDLSVPGREVIQVLVGFASGVVAPSTRGRDCLCRRRDPRVSARRQTTGDAQGRRRLVHPGWNDPLGEERWQRQRG
jgi:hypothetical protein